LRVIKRKKGEKIMTKRFNAFTLAEVLITLGIIGVVAAMTMPTLMNQTNGAQYKAAYKKALSAIAQGVTLNVALDGGSFADVIAGKTGADAKTPSTGTGDTVASILGSRMNVVNLTGTLQTGYNLDTKTGAKVCKPDKPSCTDDADKIDETISVDTYMFFNDGIMFAYKAGDAVACTQDTNITGHKVCLGVIDVNGAKGPNKAVKCDNGTSGDTCKVTNPTDIYPVQFYDQTILPASDAAKAVLYGK